MNTKNYFLTAMLAAILPAMMIGQTLNITQRVRNTAGQERCVSNHRLV